MLVESFHNILKSVYLKRIPNKRLDDLLYLMLQIEEDYYTRYTNALNMERLPNEDLKDVKLRHVRGEKIPTSPVLQESSTLFRVKSQEKEETGDPVYYHVVKSTDSCSSMPCMFVCPELACKGLCSHLYQCSCPDFSPLCEHIHRVHLPQKMMVVQTLKMSLMTNQNLLNLVDQMKICLQINLLLVWMQLPCEELIPSGRR